MAIRSAMAGVALTVASLVPSSAAAQSGAPQGCSAPEYRQFDFWIGEWSVVNQRAQGSRKPARNRISSINDGCAILEEYSFDAFNGSSISYYDRNTGNWNQVWIDNRGSPLVQEGSWKDGAMVLLGTTVEGKESRVIWTPREDGSVRQVWEQSADGGTTWSVVFDGIYTKASGG